MPAMSTAIPAQAVREVLGQRILTSGMDVVCDLMRCKGNRLWDAARDTAYLDMFTFYASRPLTFDHPALVDPAYRERMGRLAAHKPSNCDIYTGEYAAFVEAMSRTAAADWPHMFVVSGGALAVENALKCDFDWKSHKNEAAGRSASGGRVAHFEHAFHGRSGYTMSLTDSPDPRKTARYPKFTDWPRLPTPSCRFPLDEGDNLALTAAAEEDSLGRLRRIFEEAPHEIAAILIEPIQGEGGDAHLRPEFLRGLRALADEHEALLIFDEVQTGFGLTGSWWAYQELGVKPDLVCFGKKFQVCGFLASDRVDDVDGVFKVPSRISSTFEGNLVDMVRCTEVLNTVERDGLLGHVKAEGAWLLEQLHGLASRHDWVTAPRGMGLMVAFDLPDGDSRDEVLERCFEEGLIILGCGDRSLRFRPSLDVSRDDLAEALAIIERCLP